MNHIDNIRDIDNLNNNLDKMEKLLQVPNDGYLISTDPEKASLPPKTHAYYRALVFYPNLDKSE